MTQYDAGPGDRSDREWEAPEHRPAIHARRKGPKLPPWALLAIVVGILILLCVALVLALTSIKNRARNRPTPEASATHRVVPLGTQGPTTMPSGPTQTPSPTVELPALTTTPPVFTQIAPGASVVVQGVGAQGLNVRADATTGAQILETVKDGTTLTVVDGPKQGNGYTWWKVRTPAGKEGWAVADFLVLKASP